MRSWITRALFSFSTKNVEPSWSGYFFTALKKPNNWTHTIWCANKLVRQTHTYIDFDHLGDLPKKNFGNMQRRPHVVPTSSVLTDQLLQMVWSSVGLTVCRHSAVFIVTRGWNTKFQSSEVLPVSCLSCVHSSPDEAMWSKIWIDEHPQIAKKTTYLKVQ